MINLTCLSHAALFCTVEYITWPENTNWQAIYPLVSEFTELELEKLFPNRKSAGEDQLRKKLEGIISDLPELFDPIEHYFIQLPDLKIPPRRAQTILYRAKSPCRIVELDSKFVLTCPGDSWNLSDLISRAFLLLGYIPPFVIQEPNGFEFEARDSHERCLQFIQRQVDALVYEFQTLSSKLT